MTEQSDEKLLQLANSAAVLVISRISMMLLPVTLLPLLAWELNSLDALRLDMREVKTSLALTLPEMNRRLDQLETWRNSSRPSASTVNDLLINTCNDDFVGRWMRPVQPAERNTSCAPAKPASS